jgi:hypothetical protein
LASWVVAQLSVRKLVRRTSRPSQFAAFAASVFIACGVAGSHFRVQNKVELLFLTPSDQVSTMALREREVVKRASFCWTGSSAWPRKPFQ